MTSMSPASDLETVPSSRRDVMTVDVLLLAPVVLVLLLSGFGKGPPGSRASPSGGCSA
jgi:hypothetical protein